MFIRIYTLIYIYIYIHTYNLMFLVSSVRAQDLIGAASLLLDLSYITQLDQEAQPHHHVEWVLYIPNDVLWQVGGDTVSNNVIIMRAVTYLTERGDNIPPLTISIFSLFLQDTHCHITEAKARIAKLGARAGRFTKLAKLLRRREWQLWVMRCYVRPKGWVSWRHTSKQGW